MAKKTQTIRKKGKKPITFEKGGLHRSLGVPQDQPIPPEKLRRALSGAAGPKAKKQAEFDKHVLTGPKKKVKKGRG